MWNTVILRVSLVRFRNLHADVCRREGALIIIAVQHSRWAATDSRWDVMVSR